MIELIKLSMTDDNVLKFANNGAYDVNSEIKGADGLSEKELSEVSECVAKLVPLLLNSMIIELKKKESGNE